MNTFLNQPPQLFVQLFQATVVAAAVQMVAVGVIARMMPRCCPVTPQTVHQRPVFPHPAGKVGSAIAAGQAVQYVAGKEARQGVPLLARVVVLAVIRAVCGGDVVQVQEGFGVARQGEVPCRRPVP